MLDWEKLLAHTLYSARDPYKVMLKEIESLNSKLTKIISKDALNIKIAMRNYKSDNPFIEVKYSGISGKGVFYIYFNEPTGYYEIRLDRLGKSISYGSLDKTIKYVVDKG